MPYKDPQKQTDWARAYYLKNRDLIRERTRIYQQDHPEHLKVYRQEHRGSIREAASFYRALHPDIIRAIDARRRARSCGLPATLTSEQWKAIQQAYKHRCAYCGTKPKKLTQDHVIPLSKGGGTTPDNIVPACLSCNSRKHAGPPPSLPALRLML